MKNYLLITLGHNSSAIFVDNSGEKQQIIGYEQERLSGIKADSQFPIDAINEIIHNVGIHKVKGCIALVSHWFNDVKNFKNIPNKYITQNDIDFLNHIAGFVAFTNSEFTHHDAHAWSAYEFFKYHMKDRQVSGKLHCLVVDGFGTNEEVLSLYECNKDIGLSLTHRTFDLHASLGLFYQYATSYVGMKENQDEYKFLGYEAHIDEMCSIEEIEKLNARADTFSDILIARIMEHTEASADLPYSIIDYKQLASVREEFNNIFDDVFKIINSSLNRDSYGARCIIAYFVQSVCERVLVAFIEKMGIQNLIVVGGTFYNVKLNNVLLNNIDGLFCAMPLAGDQGAAIGMYAAKEIGDKAPFQFGDLCWGKRRFYNARKLVEQRKCNSKIVYLEPINKAEYENATEVIANLIANGNIVNIVTRNMEFGPRALCNTSTIFLPTSENTHCNNEMNGRNEVMPCAPICTKANAIKLFGQVELDRVIGSDRYMICTHTYNKPYSSHYGGIMHKKPLKNEYTGRPQIVKPNSIIDKILTKVERMTDYKALVNTSFNVHGRPIAFDIISILENYEYQYEHAVEGKEPWLFIFDC